MTVLQRPDPTTERSDPPARPSVGSVLVRVRALGLAAVAGALAALISLMVVLLPVVLAWFFEERSAVSLPQAMGIGVDLWALAHRGAVTVGEVEIVLAPLLLTLVPFLVCRYAANQVIVDRPEVRGTLPDVRGAVAAWRAVGGAEMLAFVAGYVVAGLALSSLAGLGQAPVRPGSVLPGLLLVPVAAVLAGLWREHRHQEHPTLSRGLDWLHAHVPVLVRRGLRPAVEALAVLTVAGLAVVVALLILRADRVGALYAALDAGSVGTGVLTAAQLAALPNAVLWAVGWAAGAPVHVGSVAIGWEQGTAGDLPLIPVLGALPEPGPMPTWLWAIVLVPLLTGVWVGIRAVRSAPRLATWWTKAQIAGSACVGAAAVVVVLSWLASGGMTPGLLGLVGTEPLQVGLLLLGELLAGALLTVTLLHLARRRLSPRRS